MKMGEVDTYKTHGNIFTFYCSVNLEKNEAKVWRTAWINGLMNRVNNHEELMVEVEGVKCILIKHEQHFYLQDENGKVEISVKEAKDLIAEAILKKLNEDFYFDGRIDKTSVSIEEDRILLIEEPRTIQIFNDENKFYADLLYNTEWLEKRGDEYYVCNKDYKEGLKTNIPQYLIAKVLLGQFWRKHLFTFPDKE